MHVRQMSASLLPCRAGRALLATAVWLGVLLATASVSDAHPPTGRVTPHEWRAKDKVKAELVTDFDLWSPREPGAQASCSALSGERSSVQAVAFAKTMHGIGAQLHTLAVEALDLKGWGQRLAGRAGRYHGSARGRVSAASTLIADGADWLYQALHDLGDAYTGISRWSCNQNGPYLAAGGEFANGRAKLNEGFAKLGSVVL